MRARLAAALALLAFLGACANPPRWVKRTAPFNILYRPWALPYLENPKFSFELKRDWKGPENVDGGVRFRAPRGDAAISVTYVLEGAEGWRAPKAWRQWMRQQGATEDSHVVDSIVVSSRPAQHVIYTEHHYDPEVLLGERSTVRKVELLVHPDEQGVFLIRYEGLRRDFERHRGAFLRMLESLTLAFADPPPAE